MSEQALVTLGLYNEAVERIYELKDRIAQLEQQLAEAREATTDSLVKAWQVYTETFGEPPHGTKPQLAALLALVHPVAANPGGTKI